VQRDLPARARQPLEHGERDEDLVGDPAGSEHLDPVDRGRDDGWLLYGFATAEERRLFQRLMGTTGVGPALAMNLLSTLTAERLVRAVREGDLASRTQVPRVGKKLAERLVLELRDKLEGGDLPAGPVSGAGSASGGGPGADAVRALVALGYGASDAERAVRRALEGAPAGESTADLIRRARGGRG
ncbi:MAG: Holliday junction branch migration protein RuvA, partial [Gemmatimonadota bacterium]